jgi:alkyl sulfatase BDS1-like metallo-beta-lactamase superfamily hydrolase
MQLVLIPHNVVLSIVVGGVIACLTGCTETKPIKVPGRTPGNAALIDCATQVGAPRVEKVTERVYVAIGYDLANTVLIKTSVGNVFVDVGMHPESARRMRTALEDQVPGPVAAIIYTHSHIDHVGGASAYAGDATPIWASAAFAEHFFKQYGMFQPLEAIRAQRQYGMRVSVEALPCTSIGARPDLAAVATSGARMPNRTFQGTRSLSIGGVAIELIEAHGETHDQIMVWLPAERVLLTGDNFYRAFPNLYTIRGTSPRPVDAWIASLDKMRRLAPEFLVPGHTAPVRGKEAIQTALRDYRDGIQWVRDATVRGANAGKTPDEIVATLSLPPHLAASPNLAETYGEVGWSARGIYASSLGWFNGEPEDLYPAPPGLAAAGEITLMGGFDKVLTIAEQAAEAGDPRWALHLLRKLRQADVGNAERYKPAMSKAMRRLADTTPNTNGRAYLLESAVTQEEGPATPILPQPDDQILAATPVEVFLDRMAARLDLDASKDVEETVTLEFPDLKRRYILTQRRGVLEVSVKDPLPGTPTSLATLTIDSAVWKRVAVSGGTSVLTAAMDGKIKISGDRLALAGFFARFKRSD